MPCHGCNSGETLQDAMAELGVPGLRQKQFRWLWVPTGADARIEAVIKSWVGTPYQFGGRTRGAGADCRGFVCGVLDELYRKPEPTPLPEVGPDAAIHSDEVAQRAAQAMIRAYDAVDVKDEGVIEAGDVVVAKADRGAERGAHALIASSRTSLLYHAPNVGGSVRTISIYDVSVIKVYRPADKGTWA